MISVVELVLSLLGTLLGTLKIQGAPQEIIAGVESALAALAKVHNTPVTYSQLESLRANVSWPDQPKG